MLVHASCVSIDGAGVLLRGPPGSGKSDLALRLIDGGGRLVADDQVELTEAGGRVLATAPGEIAGRMEVRGIGIVALDDGCLAPDPVALALVCDLVRPDAVERLPDAAHCDLLGISIASIKLAPFETSAAAKLRLAVKALKRDSTPPSLSTRDVKQRSPR